MECRFCDIINNRERIVRKSMNTVTILSNPYLLRGHYLVMPKQYYEKLTEIPDWLLFELIREIKGIEKLLLERFGTSGCDVRQNYRPFLQESRLKVNHLHFHILPRENEDELY